MQPQLVPMGLAGHSTAWCATGGCGGLTSMCCVLCCSTFQLIFAWATPEPLYQCMCRGAAPIAACPASSRLPMSAGAPSGTCPIPGWLGPSGTLAQRASHSVRAASQYDTSEWGKRTRMKGRQGQRGSTSTGHRASGTAVLPSPPFSSPRPHKSSAPPLLGSGCTPVGPSFPQPPAAA